MRITRWGEYGILCCSYLAQKFNNGAVGASEIAGAQNLPIKYAQQILHRLRRGGVIKSIRGPHGGFLLAREPGQISLREIVNAAEGYTFEVMCDKDPIHHSYCNDMSRCALNKVWHEVQGAIDGVLQNQSLSALVDQQKELTARRAAQPQVAQPGHENGGENKQFP